MTGARIVVQVGLEDLLAHLRALLLIVGKAAFDAVGNGAALPPGAQIQNLLPLLVVADVELVVLALLKGRMQNLVDDPGHGEFRVDGRRLCGSSNLAQDQIFIIHVKAGVQQDIFERVCALQLAGCTGVLLIGFGDQTQTLHVDLVGAVKEGLAQAVDPGVRRPVLVMNLVTQAVSLVKRLGATCSGVLLAHFDSS